MGEGDIETIKRLLLAANLSEEKMVETQAPLGRIGQPDDIAPTAVYLASSDSKYMTGETLLVSGGLR